MLRICLIVAHEPFMREHVKVILQAAGFDCLEAASAPEAFRMVQTLTGSIDVIVAEVDTPGDMSAQDLAYTVHASYPKIPVILMCGQKSLQEIRLIRKEFPVMERSMLPEAVVRIIQHAIAPRSGAAGAA